MISVIHFHNAEDINMTKLDFFYKTPDADFLDGLLHRTDDELNRFEYLIKVMPTGRVNAYGYPIKNYKMKWKRSQKAEWNRLERRHK